MCISKIREILNSFRLVQKRLTQFINISIYIYKQSKVLVHAQQVIRSRAVVVCVVAKALINVLSWEAKACRIFDYIVVYLNVVVVVVDICFLSAPLPRRLRRGGATWSSTIHPV